MGNTSLYEIINKYFEFYVRLKINNIYIQFFARFLFQVNWTKRLLNLWLHQDVVLKTRLDQLLMEGRRDTLFKVIEIIDIQGLI